MATKPTHAPVWHTANCDIFQVGGMQCTCDAAKNHSPSCGAWYSISCDCGYKKPSRKLDIDELIEFDLAPDEHTCWESVDPLWRAGKPWTYCRTCGKWMREWTGNKS